MASYPPWHVLLAIPYRPLMWQHVAHHSPASCNLKCTWEAGGTISSSCYASKRCLGSMERRRTSFSMEGGLLLILTHSGQRGGWTQAGWDGRREEPRWYHDSASSCGSATRRATRNGSSIFVASYLYNHITATRRRATRAGGNCRRAVSRILPRHRVAQAAQRGVIAPGTASRVTSRRVLSSCDAPAPGDGAPLSCIS